MDSTDLETFVAVAEDRSFSRAAERLHLTQPAVTKRIKRLEESLGTDLFDRIGRRVELTQGGALLLPRAQSLLAEIADTRRLLENLSDQVSGSLLLATSHHVGLHRLAPVLKTFSDRYTGGAAGHPLRRLGSGSRSGPPRRQRAGGGNPGP